MEKKRVLSIMLLFAFLSFLISHYPGGNVKALTMQKSKAIIVINDSAESLHLKVDNKKHPFMPFAVTESIAFLILILFLFRALFFQTDRRSIILTPVFYQANYVSTLLSCQNSK
ncbi:hypothetical protein BGM26_15705 [Bacillus sp. FJAT-29790]|uniref:hypothetical protein n=1 Tax=Bacillus sp. FJAT-29790 TaxID=1895002 RepID=UPI001C248192|nr:hypothetical protein [Bacillus sp. FJAT-29790]MBU8880398.1 hypothetical protein [Bacillus sp. FJAT-29790]